MQRMPTTLAFSAWAGFSAVSALGLLRKAGFASDGTIAALPLPQSLGLGSGEATGFAAILAALAIALGLTLASLHSTIPARTRRAEPVAASLLTAIFGLYLATAIAGSPSASLFGDGPGFLFALALSFGALLFDHMVATDDIGDREYEAAMRAIEAARRDALAQRERPTGKSDRR
jgi:hypothetical protein